MHQLKIIFDFYLDASIHVALSVVTLYYITIETLALNSNGALALFIGFGTIVCYNFIKYGVEAEKYLIVSNDYHKIIQMFSFTCFGFACYYGLQLPSNILWAIFLLGILSGLYALPVLPQAKNLRSLGVIKIFIVAMVWTGFTVVLPIIDTDHPLNWDAIVLICQRFCLVLALILPFEVRDMAYDSADLKTVPQRLGIKGTKKFGLALMVLFFGFTFLKDMLAFQEIFGRFLVAAMVCFFLIKMKSKQSPYFSSFWVESVPIFWLVILLIFQKIV